MRFFIATLLLLSPIHAQNLTVGWMGGNTYLKKAINKDPDLDLQTVRIILNKARVKVDFVSLRGSNENQNLQDSDFDILTGVYIGQDLPKNFEPSKPYKYAAQTLFYIKPIPKEPRIGVLYSYIPVIPVGFSGLDNQARFIKYNTLPRLFTALEKGLIDACMVDQERGGIFVWEKGLTRIQYRHLEQKIPVSLGFNVSMPQDLKERINQAIDMVQPLEFETTQTRCRKYYRSLMFSRTVSQPWFFAIDIIGTIAFAISGIIVAYRERMTIFASFLMALLPAVCGGVIRDLVVGRRPIFIVANRYYLFSIITTVILGLVFIRFFSHRKSLPKKNLEDVLEFFDALGLASFAVIGVWVAFLKDVQPLWLWGPLLGVLTAVGGGIVRDLFRSDNVYTSLKGEIYPEIALFWASCLTSFLLWPYGHFTPIHVYLAVIGCMCGAFLMRLYVYRKGWKSITLNKLRG